MFAILQSGGKQYRVSEGDVLRLESLVAEPGEVVVFPVMMLAGDQVEVGTPLVPGASVKAEVLEHGRGDKIHVYKYKAKVNYRRKIGHRQPYTEVRITEIGAGAAKASGAVEAEQPAEEAAPADVAEAAE